MSVTVRLHRGDDGKGYWGEVIECPGVFAAGDTLAELGESLEEALDLVGSEWVVWD